jgi:hypothetical protein
MYQRLDSSTASWYFFNLAIVPASLFLLFANCGFKHPTKVGVIPCAAVLAIPAHFVAKDIGWFNKYHFMKVPDEEVKKLLGNVKGISSKAA